MPVAHALPPFVALSSERLDLIAIDWSHVDAMYTYASDPEVTRYVAWPRHESREVTREFVAWSQAQYAAGGHYDWGLWLRGASQMIGTCGIVEIDWATRCGEIGYVLNKQYWRRGLAFEAVSTLLDFAVHHLGLARLEAQVFPENAASQRLLAKLGFRYVETRMLCNEYDGAVMVVGVWALGHEQWRSRSFDGLANERKR